MSGDYITRAGEDVKSVFVIKQGICQIKEESLFKYHQQFFSAETLSVGRFIGLDEFFQKALRAKDSYLCVENVAGYEIRRS